MKKSINRNITAAEYFVNILSKFGVEDICLSPGSRNTPLTVAISKNSSINSHIIVDERASCFFALGLVKQTGRPVAVVTTSGTAAAELTPGIVEAYFSRVPLIICTADRPGYLAGRGANQVINQRNMFSNHVREFYDAGLPRASLRWFNRFGSNIKKKLDSLAYYPGPVHFNFPFEKPFEPGSTTDQVDPEFLKGIKLMQGDVEPYKQNSLSSKQLSKKLIESILKSKKILLSAGPLHQNSEITESILKLALKLKCPVAPDGLARTLFKSSPNVIDNFSTLALSSEFRKKYDPDLIIHFGSAYTSNSALEFIKGSKAHKIVVNAYGDKIDPTKTVNEFIKYDPSQFCSALLKENMKRNDSSANSWHEEISKLDSEVEQLKAGLILKKRFPFEGRVIAEIYSSLPENSNLFLSNSMPVRDFEYFITGRKKINLYYNRGASGIDGIVSSACGTGQNSNSPTTLIIGDLAFYHDLNSLYLSKHLKKPLIVILINNGGGGIFDMLPIAGEKIDFEKYFKTPVDLDYAKIVKAFDLNYFGVKNWTELKSGFNRALKSRRSSVIEIKSNSKESLEIRRKFWNESQATVSKKINENSAR